MIKKDTFRSIWKHYCIGLFSLLIIDSGTVDASTPTPVFSDERVKEIASWLAPEPQSTAPALYDREAWEELGRKAGPRFFKRVDKELKSPPPELTDDLYLVFSQRGTRSEYMDPYVLRRGRLAAFVLAEGITNEGKYLKAAEDELAAILSERTWVMPAHDRDLRKFKGEIQDVDLGAAMRAASVASAVAILGDKLPEDLRDEALEKLRIRIFEPYQKKIRGEDPSLCFWTKRPTNWNAVCHAGVLSAALQTLPDPKERAEMIAAAEVFMTENFLQGFGPDGFCEEGMTYYNYGFGHFVIMAEVILGATQGNVNWWQWEQVQRAASFPEKMEMAPDLFASFGDCRLKTKPVAWILAICRQRLFSSKEQARPAPSSIGLPLLYEWSVTGFPLVFAEKATVGVEPPQLDPLRGWFPNGGVLTSRFGDSDPGSLSVTLKGGHNGENHNHNDLGQFVVGVYGELPLIDPGSLDVYTADSFGPRRYEHDLMSSRGHSVPVVAGRYQQAGEKSRARVVEKEFSQEQDRLVLDIASAYPVPELERLDREFTYLREGRGVLTVTDYFAFSEPQTFESALITYGTLIRESENTLVIGDKKNPNARVRIQIDTGGLPFHVAEGLLNVDKQTAPRRIAVILDDKVAEGTVTFRITPASAVDDE